MPGMDDARAWKNNLNTNLAGMVIQSVIINKTGTYGYAKDCIGSVIFKNKTAFFHIEGEFSGTLDLLFVDWGVPAGMKTPTAIYGDPSIGGHKLLASVSSESGNNLYVRCFSDNYQVQISATATDIYDATFAVTFQ